MVTLFVVAGAIAVVTSAMAVSRSNAVHALLYLVVSLLAVGMVFFILGAPFAAALEVIIYAGAIIVLFIFVIMMLNAGGARSIDLPRPAAWIVPGLFALILLAELFPAMRAGARGGFAAVMVPPAKVGASLLGPYLLGVELASILLLAGLVGAYHLAVRIGPERKGGPRHEPRSTC